MNRNERFVPLHCQIERRKLRGKQENIALAKQENFPRQAAKRSPIGDARTKILCLIKNYYNYGNESKAVEKLLKFDKNSAGVYRYVMSPEMYSSQNQKKVIKEAAPSDHLMMISLQEFGTSVFFS